MSCSDHMNSWELDEICIIQGSYSNKKRESFKKVYLGEQLCFFLKNFIFSNATSNIMVIGVLKYILERIS